MSKRAVILAGGKGVRLKPYTTVLPKPLMPIGEYPILEVVIRQLSYYGFNHITMAVNHQAELIKAYFQSGEKWNVKIDYSMENIPLSTMGPLKLIHDLPENFLIMNGDVLTDLDFKKFLDFHNSKSSLFTISSYQRSEKQDYGVLHTNDKGYLTSFEEKPVYDFTVSMGVYAANIAVLDIIPDGIPYGFDNLMVDMIKLGKQPLTKLFSGYWLDIGRPDDYMKAIDEFESGKDIFIK